MPKKPKQKLEGGEASPRVTAPQGGAFTPPLSGGHPRNAPEDWPVVRIGDVASVKHGYAFGGEFFVDEPTEYILVTPGNFAIGGGFKFDKQKYYRGPVPNEFILRNGDLIVTMTDLSKISDTLGYGAIVPTLEGKKFLHNQRIGKVIITRPDLILPNFLYWILRTKEYRNEVLASASGSTVKHTAPKRIEAYQFGLPRIGAQRAISIILSGLEEKFENNSRMNGTLEAMARALFKDWFVDFGPVRAKMEGREPPGLPVEVAELFPSELDERGNPLGWKTSIIGDEVQVVGGSTPSTGDPRFWDGGEYFWTTPKDLSALDSPVLLNSDRKITSAGLETISSGLLPKGTLLLSSRAPIGYLAITEIPTAINQGFIAMKCEKALPNLYVLIWCIFSIDLILGNANGSTFQEISKSNFRPLPVLVPPPHILRAFQKTVQPLYEKIVGNLRENETLTSMRDYLLPKLLSGEIRLNRNPLPEK